LIFIYCDVDVEFDKGIGGPAHAVDEADEGQGEGHVLDALGLDHKFLHFPHNFNFQSIEHV